MNIKILLPVLLLVFYTGFAYADTGGPMHALALHGAPKYGPDAAHFDYVNPDAPKGGTLKLAAIGSFDSLNPFIVKGTPASGLSYLGQSLLYDSLMEQSYDEPFTMYCLVCETVEMARDRSWIAFNLRAEAKWHDGTKITADDVVFSFHSFMDQGTPFFKAYYGDVESVTAETPRRVVFKLKNLQNAELPLIIGQMAIIPKHGWSAPGHAFGQSSLTVPLGSGPYKIGAVNAGRSIEYRRDPDYWGKDLAINKGRFNFGRIIYDYYRDNDVALEAFFAGQYDMREENTAKLWATAYNAKPVQDGRIIKDEIAHARPQGLQGFLYNIRKPLFADPKLREALSYAFDFEWSNRQFAYNSYKRSRSYFSNSDLAATGAPSGRELDILNAFKGRIPERVFTEEYNPPKTDGSGNNRANLAKARQLLDEAGYKIGVSGLREKDGRRLEFEIIDSNPQFERWVLPFIANLKRLGVKANFRTIDPAQYQNRMNNFDFDMTIGTYPESESPGNEQRDFWGSAKADAAGSRNYIGVKDPVIDALIDGLIAAKSRQDLVAYCHALDRVLQWNFYTIPQWHNDRWRLAWWAKLQKPEHLSGLTPAVADTWWAKP